MADEDHESLLRRDVADWNQWRSTNSVRPDLSGADLIGCNLDHANLVNVDLSGSKLDRASFRHASIAGADLGGASLVEAYLYHTQIAAAVFANANLFRTVFQHGAFEAVDLSGARLGDTIFSGCDLSDAIGLPSCLHIGPSSIDTRTLEASGRLPEEFLRGCGLSDDFIHYIPSLFWIGGIELFSCFISYTHGDNSLARKLHGSLQSKGVRCWLDVKQLAPGDDIYDGIDRGIRLWDKVLLLCSRASLTSGWVDAEISKALEKERALMSDRGKRVNALIPLDLDGYVFDNSESGKRSELLSRVVADFKDWEEDDDAQWGDRVESVISALRADAGREAPPPKKL